MNPGIYYLYEYNQNQRLRNVGFLKIVPHYRSRLLQIHMRGISIKPGQSLPLTLSLFYMDGAENIYKELSEFLCKDKTVSFQITVPESHLPDNQTWNDIDGILLYTGDGRYFSAMTNGSMFDSRKLRMWKAADEIHILSESCNAGKTSDASENITANDIHTTAEIANIPDKVTVSNVDADTDKTTLNAIEADSTETFIAIPDEIAASELSSFDEIASPEFSAPDEIASLELSAPDEIASPRFPVIRKIQRSQLSILPRRCWNLANNSFLMHGYHNYNHLLLIEEDGHYILGVPGIFSMREARAAELFGFPKFTKEYTETLGLERDEHSPSENFGHWCRTIPY